MFFSYLHYITLHPHISFFCPCLEFLRPIRSLIRILRALNSDDMNSAIPTPPHTNRKLLSGSSRSNSPYVVLYAKYYVPIYRNLTRPENSTRAIFDIEYTSYIIILKTTPRRQVSANLRTYLHLGVSRYLYITASLVNYQLIPNSYK